MQEFVTIFSTLSVDQTYTSYQVIDSGSDRDAPRVKVLLSHVIKGGANMSDLHGTHVIHTPKGVANRVTRNIYEDVLKKSHVFLMHVNNGFISVDETGSIDVEKAVSNMSVKDKSAQKNETEIKAMNLKSTDDVTIEVGKAK